MEQQVRFGGHRFDPGTGRLWAGRREVKVTPRAAAVLAALVERAGHPVSRDELFRLVWRDAVVGDAALTACIQELRGVLDDDPRRPRFIQTRHRRAYRFVARVIPCERAALTGASPSRTGWLRPGVIVGRDRDLSELRGCLERAMDASRQIVFITGEPGIGKTTAVAAFLAEAASRRRLRIAQGQCVDAHGAGEPYLPLLEAMTRLCRGPGGRAIARLLRHHAPTWLAEMLSVAGASERGAIKRKIPGVTQERMLREMAEVVEVMAEEVPLVLWLEDHCPEVVIEGDKVRIGEDANTAVLEREEWNVLVDLIQSGRIGRI